MFCFAHHILNLFQGPLLRVQLEAYIDDHPEFLESYIARKVDKTSLGKLMMQEELKYGNTSRKLSQISIKKTSTGRLRKGSITPQRKISVSSFAGCSVSSLLSTVEDNALSFLSLTPDFRKKSAVITDLRNKSTVITDLRRKSTVIKDVRRESTDITEINKTPPDDVEDVQEIFMSELT